MNNKEHSRAPFNGAVTMREVTFSQLSPKQKEAWVQATNSGSVGILNCEGIIVKDNKLYIKDDTMK